jgi:hypothetical protein
LRRLPAGAGDLAGRIGDAGLPESVGSLDLELLAVGEVPGRDVAGPEIQLVQAGYMEQGELDPGLEQVDGLGDIAEDTIGIAQTEAGCVAGAVRGLADSRPVKQLFRLSWKWRGRTSVKITESRRETDKEALHTRREGRRLAAPFVEPGADLEALR